MKLKAVLSALFLSCALACTQAQSADLNLPEIGTAGVLGMTVQKERAIGDYFMRVARSRLAIVNDPVLTEYVASVGGKLVMSARNVAFPFEFFVVNDPTLNASAFLGGKVQINTGLFMYAATEDEFASVLAHEISHVTQRHLARYIENEVRKQNISIAGMIGGIVMAIINPAMGMAALSTSFGASQQNRINFTRANESEADRIGIDLLYRAGFNPKGMVDMFRHLLAMQGNINPMFAMLVDHPLSDIRVAEAQSRAAQLPSRNNSTNPDFELARARVDVRYKKGQNYNDLKQVLLQNPERRSKVYLNYALALTCYELKDYQGARDYAARVGLNSNLFIVDLLTDIDLNEKRYDAAIARLSALRRSKPDNQAVVINLANVYQTAGRHRQAVDLLENYLRRNDNQDPLALNMMAESHLKLGDRCEGLQAKGEYYSLSAGYNRAISMYNQALGLCHNRLTRERIKARVAEIANQRAFDEELNRG